MYRKPEELVMAVLGLLFIGLSCYIAAWSGATAKYIFLITMMNMFLALLTFLAWQRDLLHYVWPLLLGGWVISWWPWLDWYVIKDVASNNNSLVVVNEPWYASWPFKLFIAALPVVLGYGLKWRYLRKREQADKF